MKQKKHLQDIYNNDANPDKAKTELSILSEKFLNINYYENHLSALIYVRALDNFITYFKEILSEVVISKPQILKSKESENLDFILAFDTMDELAKAIATKKIEELFYKGIEDIEKFFKKRLGISIFKNENEKSNINFLIKQRNLAVHNRRKISKDFIKQFPDFNLEDGKYLTYTFSYVSQINLLLFNFLVDIDEEISKKFKLKKIALRE